jgi:hypothetical protein
MGLGLLSAAATGGGDAGGTAVDGTAAGVCEWAASVGCAGFSADFPGDSSLELRLLISQLGLTS